MSDDLLGEQQVRENLKKMWEILCPDHSLHCIASSYLREVIPNNFLISRIDDLWEAAVIYGQNSYSSDRHEYEETALLLAYLRMRAQQRSIEPDSEWVHFKGDLMRVVAVAREKYPGVDVTLIGDFKAEEEPSVIIQLYRLTDGTFVYFSGNMLPQCDRVFYYHDGKGWARTKDNFLGLVGAEHPESYGLLRFAEVTK